MIGLGLAGGVVPCWDAVVLILLAEAVGRIALGLALLTAFSLGMACVLVAVGLTASRLRGFLQSRDADGAWVRRLGLASAGAVTMIGVYLTDLVNFRDGLIPGSYPMPSPASIPREFCRLHALLGLAEAERRRLVIADDAPRRSRTGIASSRPTAQ